MMERLFENIRAECRANEWTIIELTEKLGIKRKTFYNWEQKQDIPASCLVKI